MTYWWTTENGEGITGVYTSTSIVFRSSDGGGAAQRDVGNWFSRLLGTGSLNQKVNRALNAIEERLPENINNQGCKDIFDTLGVDYEQFLGKMNEWHFIDGSKSTDKIDDIMGPNWASVQKISGWTVADLFKNGYPKDALVNGGMRVTALSPSGSDNVYILGSSITNGQVGHEMFHKFNLYDENLLLEKWGLNPKGPSSQFSEYFARKCLK
jgi:hypothetical protein